MFVCFFRSAESAKSLQHDSVMAGVVTLQMTSFLAVSLLLHHCYCHWWLTGIWFPHTVADSSSLDTSVGQQDAWDTGDHTRQPDGRLKTDGSACRQPWSHSQRCRFYSDYNFFTLQCVLFYKFIKQLRTAFRVHVMSNAVIFSLCPVVQMSVPLFHANMDCSTGWVSLLYTCSSGDIIWPCTVLSTLVMACIWWRALWCHNI